MGGAHQCAAVIHQARPIERLHGELKAENGLVPDGCICPRLLIPKRPQQTLVLDCPSMLLQPDLCG